MNIFVLLKRTFDTEEKIILKNGVIQTDEAEFIVNPYDEYAVEEAISLKETHGGEVTVITVGDEESEKELRTALAMGCDKAVLINMEEVGNKDPFTTSTILATYLKDKSCDVILAGNVAIDGATGQVGPRLAGLLDIPCITSITKLEIDGKNVKVERDVEGDTEIVKSKLPIVLTAQQGLNEPRYPSLPGIMKAKKKPLEILELEDLDLDEEDVSGKTKTIEIYLPNVKQAGKILEGDISSQVKQLTQLLYSEAKVI